MTSLGVSLMAMLVTTTLPLEVKVELTKSVVVDGLTCTFDSLAIEQLAANGPGYLAVNGSTGGTEAYRIDKKTFEKKMLWHERGGVESQLPESDPDAFIEEKARGSAPLAEFKKVVEAVRETKKDLSLEEANRLFGPDIKTPPPK